MINEEELLKGLMEKDTKAFEDFVDVYSIDILKTISYVLKESHEKDYIEECFNDVVIKIWKKCDTFKFECPFRNWIMTIARNNALDYKRRLRSYYNQVDIEEQVISSGTLEEEYFNKEILKEISQVINELKEEEKGLFIKKFIFDNSTTELCNYYVISENVLYKRLSRLRKKVKIIWENKKIKEEN